MKLDIELLPIDPTSQCRYSQYIEVCSWVVLVRAGTLGEVYPRCPPSPCPPCPSCPPCLLISSVEGERVVMLRGQGLFPVDSRVKVQDAVADARSESP